MHPVIRNISVPSTYQNDINEGCLQIYEKSDEWYSFMEIIKNNVKKPFEKVEWKIKNVELIINHDLDENFSTKIKELKILGRKDEELAAQCVFSKEDRLDIDEIRHNGVLCKKQVNSSEQFADPSMGVHVFAHFDRLLDWCSYKTFIGPIYIVMYKTVFGRKHFIDLPTTDSNNNNEEEHEESLENLSKPSINYDSYFIDENLRFECKFEQYYPSMAYVFDIKPNGQVSSKVRQLMPYAVLTCEILTNDYYLYNYIEQQLKVYENSSINNKCKLKSKNSLKENFYKVLPKKPQTSSKSSSKQNDVNNNQQQKKDESNKSKPTAAKTNKDTKIYVNLGDIKVMRPLNNDDHKKRQNKSLFEHITNPDKSTSNGLTSNTNLLGLKLNNNNNKANNNNVNNAISKEKSFLNVKKLNSNAIKALPSLEVEKAHLDVVSNANRNKTVTNNHSNIQQNDFSLHNSLEKLSCKVNYHKLNSTFTNVLMNEFDYNLKVCEFDELFAANKLSNILTYKKNTASVQKLPSSSVDFEKLLCEKFSLINNKHKNDTNSHQSNSSISIQKINPPPHQQQQQQQLQQNFISMPAPVVVYPPSQPQWSQPQPQMVNLNNPSGQINNNMTSTATAPTATLPKLNSVDSIADALDSELLFDLNQNLSCDTNSILNLDKDLINSIFDDIKQKGVFSIIGDITDLDNNLNSLSSLPQQQQQQQPPLFQQQQQPSTIQQQQPPTIQQLPTSNTLSNLISSTSNVSLNNITSSVHLLDNVIEPPKQNSNLIPIELDSKPFNINSKLLLKLSSDKPDDATNKPDNETNENIYSDLRYNFTIEKFTKKLKYIIILLHHNDTQKHEYVVSSEVNKFCDNCEKKLRKEIKNVPIQSVLDLLKFIDFNSPYINKLNYSNVLIDSGQNTEQKLVYDYLSNFYSHPCYLNDIKIYLYQFLDFYFTDILTASRLVKSILTVKPLDFTFSFDYNEIDPRKFKDGMKDKDLEKIAFFYKSFEIIPRKNYNKISNKIKTVQSIEEFNNPKSNEIDTSMVESENKSLEKQLQGDLTPIDMDIINSDSYDVEYFDEELALELNDLIKAIDNEINRLDFNEKYTKDVNNNDKFINGNHLGNEAVKFNLKPFKIQNRSANSLIAEIHKVFEKDIKDQKDRKSKMIRSRSRSLMHQDEFNSMLNMNNKNSKPRTKSEAESEKTTLNIEMLENEVEKAKLIGVLDDIIECSEDKVDSTVTKTNGENFNKKRNRRDSESESDRDEDYISVSANQTTAIKADSTMKTPDKKSTEPQTQKKNESNKNNNNEKQNSNSEKRSRSRQESRSKSKSKSKHLKSRSNSRTRYSRSRSLSRARNYRSRSISRGRSRSWSRTRFSKSRSCSRTRFSRSRSRMRFSRSRSFERDYTKSGQKNQRKERFRSLSRSPIRSNTKYRNRSVSNSRNRSPSKSKSQSKFNDDRYRKSKSKSKSKTIRNGYRRSRSRERALKENRNVFTERRSYRSSSRSKSHNSYSNDSNRKKVENKSRKRSRSKEYSKTQSNNNDSNKNKKLRKQSPKKEIKNNYKNETKRRSHSRTRSKSGTPFSAKSTSSSHSSSSSNSSKKNGNTSLLKQIFTNSNNTERRLKLCDIDNKTRRDNHDDKYDSDEARNSNIKTTDDDRNTHDNIFPRQLPIVNYPPQNAFYDESIYVTNSSFQQQINRYFRFANTPHLPAYLLYLNPPNITNDYYNYQPSQQYYQHQPLYSLPSNHQQYRCTNNRTQVIKQLALPSNESIKVDTQPRTENAISSTSISESDSKTEN